MKKMLKRLCTGFLALATVVTALPTTPVHAESKQYWTESAERVGIVEKVMNDGSIGSTFNEGHLTVEGEDAYCIDINTDFKNGYKTRADASSRMSAEQISDVALSIEYVKQYTDSHSGISKNHAYLLRQLVVWQRLSVHLGWQCDNVRASYDEIPKATQDEVFSGAKAFVKENKGRYECGGYIYSGEGQELGQFWAKLNVGNAKLQKTSSNTSITDGNGNYSVAGATYGVFSDEDCTKQLATLTTDENGNTDVAEVTVGTVYIKELSAPAGYKVDKTVYSLKVEAGKTATLKVSDTPKVTDTLIELFKIDMETQKDNPQGNASLAGTLYLGSLKSDVYFCIYEKDYEQYVKLGTPLEEADIINRFEIRLRNERAYYAVRDLLTYYDAEQTAFSIINQYVRFVDEEPDKRKNDWKLNDRWAWFIGDNRQSLKLTTKPEPYTLDRTLRWVQRQVAPTLKMLKRIDYGNGTDYLKIIEQQAKLTEKHEMIIKQQTTPAKDLVES